MQPQQQTVVMMAPQSYAPLRSPMVPAPMMPKPPFAVVIQTGYGMLRAALFVFGFVQLCLMFGVVCHVHVVNLVLLPLSIVVLVHAFGTFFFRQFSVRHDNPMWDFALAVLFLFQAATYLATFFVYAGYRSDPGTASATETARNTTAAGTTMAILISVCYFIIALSASNFGWLTDVATLPGPNATFMPPAPTQQVLPQVVSSEPQPYVQIQRTPLPPPQPQPKVEEAPAEKSKEFTETQTYANP